MSTVKATVRGGRIEPRERVGSRQRKQQKPEAHHTQHTEDSCGKTRRETGYADGHRNRPAAQEENPQQQRTFVCAPQCGDAVEQR